MANAEPPPPDLGSPSGAGTPPAWPDVSKQSRGYRPAFVAAAGAIVGAAGIALGAVALGPGAQIGAPPDPTTAPTLAATTATTRMDVLPLPQSVEAGECVSIPESGGSTTIEIVPCGEDDSYRVVARLDHTTDPAGCRAFPKISHQYVWDDPKDARESFVLCLRR